jgi:hypothetical protein
MKRRRAFGAVPAILALVAASLWPSLPHALATAAPTHPARHGIISFLLRGEIAGAERVRAGCTTGSSRPGCV